MTTKFQQKVWNACKRIRKGRVSTYREIAKAIKKPKAARAVGNALNRNPFRNVPCHRVVQSSGKIGGYAHGSAAKVEWLRKEGVKVKRGRVVNFKKVLQKL